MALLKDTLSGLFEVGNGLYVKFKDYDDKLSGLVSSINEIGNSIGTMTTEVVTDGIAYNVKSKVTTLSGSSSYELEDGMLYRAQISANTSFILPDVEDDSILHEIVLTLKFNAAWEVIFYDSQNTALPTLDENAWDPNDVVQYLLRYEPFLSRWCVMPVKVS